MALRAVIGGGQRCRRPSWGSICPAARRYRYPLDNSANVAAVGAAIACATASEGHPIERCSHGAHAETLKIDTPSSGNSAWMPSTTLLMIAASSLSQ